METLPAICTLSYGNTVVNVQHLPFHVGSDQSMDLQTGSDLFANHQFSLSTDIAGRLHVCVVDASGLFVDGVYYPSGCPRVLLKSVSTVGTPKLQMQVTQINYKDRSDATVIERPVGFLNESVLKYVGFTSS